MGLVWLRARSEWRSRGRELMALTLLDALVGSVVLTAVSGARRTRSSVERLDRTTRAPDALMMFTAGGSTAAKAISALPEVEVADRLSPMSFFIERGYQPLLASVDGRIGDTLERDPCTARPPTALDGTVGSRAVRTGRAAVATPAIPRITTIRLAERIGRSPISVTSSIGRCRRERRRPRRHP